MIYFCHNNLQNSHCRDCHSTNLCRMNCKDCLDDLHYHRNNIRSNYDCEHLLDFYICRYSHKYCSEMIYALETANISDYPYFNILSLGCGGAADLMAFDYMDFHQNISYIGFDNNPYWEKVHNEIEAHFSAGSVQFFRNIDVLTFFDNNENIVSNCNVLSIEYLISFFYNTVKEDGVMHWFSQLVNHIIKYKPQDSPFLVIINDVDSINTGRDTFLFLKNIIEESGLHIAFEHRMRFKDEAHYLNSVQYHSKQNKFTLPQFVKDNYFPAINCESAQLILEVR